MKKAGLISDSPCIDSDLLRHRIESQLPQTPDERVGPDEYARMSMEADWPITVADLLRITPDEEFVRKAYLQVLGRVADVPGMVHYLTMLKQGAPRRFIVASLAKSSEAQQRGRHVAGLRGGWLSPRYWIYRWRSGIRTVKLRILGILRNVSHTLLYRYFESLEDRVNALSGNIDRMASHLKSASEQEERLHTLIAKFDSLESHLCSLLEKASPPPPTMIQTAEVVATQLAGFIVAVPASEWRTAAYHAFRGPMEPGLLTCFTSLIRPGMVIVDVGANIGLFSLHAARALAGRGCVHAYEPTPQLDQILLENIQVNGFRESGIVQLHRAAVWDKSGSARLTVNPADSGQNTLFGDQNESSAVMAPTISLDEDLHSESRIDIVKIDAEGAEPWILRGMANSIRSNPDIKILIKFAPKNLVRAGVTPRQFFDLVAALDLSFEKIDDRTGEVSKATEDELLNCFSASLLLQKPVSID